MITQYHQILRCYYILSVYTSTCAYMEHFFAIFSTIGFVVFFSFNPLGCLHVAQFHSSTAVANSQTRFVDSDYF